MNRIQKQNKITTIIGHKGDGKTTLTEILILLNIKPCIIADPRGQYPINMRRRISFDSPRQLILWLKEPQNYKDFFNFKLELVCKVDDENIQDLAGAVLRMQKVQFCIDEIDMFFNSTATNKNNIYKLVHYGRHNEIDIITTSRRPANISRNLTSQTDVFYFSQLSEPVDLKYFESICDKKYTETVKSLQRYSFLRYADNEYTLIKTKKGDIERIDKL